MQRVWSCRSCGVVFVCEPIVVKHSLGMKPCSASCQKKGRDPTFRVGLVCSERANTGQSIPVGSIRALVDRASNHCLAVQSSQRFCCCTFGAVGGVAVSQHNVRTYLTPDRNPLTFYNPPQIPRSPLFLRDFHMTSAIDRPHSRGRLLSFLGHELVPLFGSRGVTPACWCGFGFVLVVRFCIKNSLRQAKKLRVRNACTMSGHALSIACSAAKSIACVSLAPRS